MEPSGTVAADERSSATTPPHENQAGPADDQRQSKEDEPAAPPSPAKASEKESKRERKTRLNDVAAKNGGEAENHENKQADEKATPSPSPTRKSRNTSQQRQPTRSLDNFDPRTVTLKKLKESTRICKGPSPVPSVAESALVLFDSPRTLQALAEEGIDPARELIQKDVKDFLLASKGDRACAEVRFKHYESRREQVLEALRKRRERIIERQQEKQQQQQELSIQRPVRTPVVQPTEHLTGTAPPPQRHGHHEASTRSNKEFSDIHGSSSDDDHQRTGDEGDYEDGFSSTSRSHRRSRRGTTTSSQIDTSLAPDEYKRRQAAAKQEKVLRQAQKMREVMEANARREKQKQEVLAKLQRQREEREADLAKKRRKAEVDRRVREANNLRREAELQILREKREQAMQAKQDELHEQREAKLRQFEEQELERQRQREREIEEMNIKRSKKRHKVALRSLAIKEYAERIIEDQRDKLNDRMDHADRVREELARKQQEELDRRREETERQIEENRKKRERAEQNFVSKITRFVERSRAAEEHRQQMKKEQHDYYLYRQLREKEKEKERKELAARVRQEEQDRCMELLQKLEEEERHCEEIRKAKLADVRLKGAERENILEDRRLAVERMQRMQQHAILEAEERYNAKMEKIEALKADAEAADRERKYIQYQAFQQRQRMAQENAKNEITSATPGPLDYNVIDAERWVHGKGPAFRMGAAVHQTRHADLAPGPGAYGAPQLPRTVKGAKLPPKDILSVDDVARLAEKAKKRKAEAAKKERRSQSRSPSPDGRPRPSSTEPKRSDAGSLPPLGGKDRLGKTTPAKSSTVKFEKDRSGRDSERSGATGRSESAPLVKASVESKAHSSGSKDASHVGNVDRPEELSDDDFHSSDEFESEPDV